MINYLSKSDYQGRCIMIGTTPDNQNFVIAYFIMGRSSNSRNRLFEEVGECVRIIPADESKVEDPRLIIYLPLRTINDATIISNGDQTDTVYSYLYNDKTFEEALRTREYEPDAPNFTPRISGILYPYQSKYRLSILKKSPGMQEGCQRFFYEYTSAAGIGHVIHTYSEEDPDGVLLPFAGEPVEIATENELETFAAHIWNALNEDNKISLLVRFINKMSGNIETKIMNKYSEIR